MLGLIAFIAIGLYLFLKVRDHQSKRSLVHQESTSVVKISVDKILTDIAWNSLMNPGYYSRKDTSDKSSSERFQRTDIGISIPANIYFFALNGNESTWYTWIDVNDQFKLKDIITTRLGADSIALNEDGENWWMTSKDGRLSFYGDSNQVLVSFSFDKKGTMDEAVEIWRQRALHLVSISTLTDFNFENSKSDIQWQQRGSETVGEMSFSSGTIVSDLILAQNLLRLPKQAKVRKLPESNVLSLYCQADLRPLFEKYKDHLQHYNIPVDTLKRYYGGYLDVQWRPTDVVQSDSVITYDYDDDFNRIEKRELHSEEVPNLSLTFKASPHLGAYLPEKLFYKFYKTVNGDQIGLSTDLNAENESSYITTENAIYLDYHYDAVVERHFGWFPQRDRMSRIQLMGKTKGTGAHFHAEIVLKEKEIHALYQLLD